MLIIFFQYLSYRKKSFDYLIKYSLIVFSVLAGSYYSLKLIQVPVDKILTERIFELDKGGLENTSAYNRIYAFTLFREFFPKKPFLGTGGKMEDDLLAMKGSRTSQIHVGWFSLFYYYGIVGAFFFLAFTYFIMKKLWHTAKKTNYWGSFYAFLTYFISILGTQVVFQIFFVGFIFAMVYNRYYEQQILFEQNNNSNLITKI